MHEYMETAHLPAEVGQEFFELIPRHRAVVHQLMASGVITSYSLASDRQTLWITIIAESIDGVRAHLNILPLYRYMECDIEELMFHNSPVFAPHRFSLN